MFQCLGELKAESRKQKAESKKQKAIVAYDISG